MLLAHNTKILQKNIKPKNVFSGDNKAKQDITFLKQSHMFLKQSSTNASAVS